MSRKVRQFQKILPSLVDYLEPKDLLNLASTSKTVSKVLLAWLKSPESNGYIFKCLQPDPNGHYFIDAWDSRVKIVNFEECIEQIKNVGALLRLVTLFDTAHQRLEISNEILNRIKLTEVSSNPNRHAKYHNCHAPSKPAKTINALQCCMESYTILMQLFASFGSTFFSTWSEKDSNDAFEYILLKAYENMSLGKFLGKLFSASYNVGSDGEMEFKLRHTLLHIFAVTHPNVNLSGTKQWISTQYGSK